MKRVESARHKRRAALYAVLQGESLTGAHARAEARYAAEQREYRQSLGLTLWGPFFEQLGRALFWTVVSALFVACMLVVLYDSESLRTSVRHALGFLP